MKPGSIPIPSPLTPGTVLTCIWWLLFLGGMFLIISGIRTRAEDGAVNDIINGLVMVGLAIGLWWLISVVVSLG